MMDHRPMFESCFEYADRRIKVSTFDKSSVDWLHEFLSPAFQPVDGKSADWTVVVATDPVLHKRLMQQPKPQREPLDCFTLDGSFASHEVLGWEGAVATVRDQNRGIIYKIDAEQSRIEILGLPDRRIQRMAVARVIREIATLHAMNIGRLHCHGASFSINGKAIILAGVKRAGKTSNLLHALHDPASNFISNDRIFVQTDSVAPIVRGMPTILKIRPKTFNFLPDFDKQTRIRPYHFLETLEEAEGSFSDRRKYLFGKSDLRTRLNSTQLCELMNTTAVCEAKLGAIVFPVISDEPPRGYLQLLEPRVASEQLFNESLLKASSPQTTAEAFRGRHEVSIVSDDDVKAQCDIITDSVPSFQFTIGPKVYQYPHLLHTLLRSAA